MVSMISKYGLQYCNTPQPFLRIGQGIGFLLSSVIASTLELIPSICPEISLIKIICSLRSIQIQLKISLNLYVFY
jgi:hypothetical protein